MSPAELEILAELVAQRVVLQLSQRGMLTAASRSARRKEAHPCAVENNGDEQSGDDTVKVGSVEVFWGKDMDAFDFYERATAALGIDAENTEETSQ